MKVAYIGFGLLGRQFKTFIDQFERPEESIFFDDVLVAQNSLEALPFNDYGNNKYKDFSFYVSLGYKNLRIKNRIIKELLGAGRKLPSFIHPSVYVSPKSKFADACFFYPGSNIDMDVNISEGVLLNNSIVVSHNCSIGSCSYLSPGVILSGNVTVGENTFLGSGTIATNHITIGNNCVTGTGTVLTKSIPDASNAIGNPFKIVSNPLKL